MSEISRQKYLNINVSEKERREGENMDRVNGK